MYLLDKRVSFSIHLLTSVSQKGSREALNFYFRLPHRPPKRLLIDYSYITYHYLITTAGHVIIIMVEVNEAIAALFYCALQAYYMSE